MIRVADFLAAELARLGLKTVFMVTGGGAMHLNDAFGRNKEFEIVFNHHEQACSMGAEGYARQTGKPAVVNVTTGPGGINALNGVFGAYTDSIPMIVISGQVKRETLARNHSPLLRQLGDQEVDIISMVRPIVKYATVLQDPKLVKAVVQKAFHWSTTGRPGPVWIDVPVDVQGALIDEAGLVPWIASDNPFLSDLELHPNSRASVIPPGADQLERQVGELVLKLKQARRPVLFLGNGIRISGQLEAMDRIVKRLGIPAVTAFNAHDLIETASPYYAGRPGTIGDRAGNFTVQNADFVLILGTRLNIRQISYNWQSFARGAWKAHVDIDSSELEKSTLSTDLKVHADLGAFFEAFWRRIDPWDRPAAHEAYRQWCKERVARYPVVLESYRATPVLNPYHFMESLFQQLKGNETIVAANATACIVSFQTAIIKAGTRLFSNSGSASMGFDLPAAIGVAVAEPERLVVCLAGDGSIMMNLQEMATIIGRRLNIKIFLLNNSGYHSIRQTQKAYFSDNLTGIDGASGVSLPDYSALATGFGFPVYQIRTASDLDSVVSVLQREGPVFCEVMLDPTQDFAPKLTSRKLHDGTMVSPTLEDMAPFLDRDEFARNMIMRQE